MRLRTSRWRERPVIIEQPKVHVCPTLYGLLSNLKLVRKWQKIRKMVMLSKYIGH